MFVLSARLKTSAIAAITAQAGKAAYRLSAIAAMSLPLSSALPVMS